MVIQECQEFIQSIVVIDDGSKDNSASIARLAGAKVIKIYKNQGVGAALGKGFEYAIANGFNTIITIDADGAHNPKDIPSLLSEHSAGSNIITIGNRWHGKYLPSNVPSTKYWANMFARYLLKRVCGFDIPDVACGFRVINNSLISHSSKIPDFGFLYEMLFIANKLGNVGFSNIDVRYNADELWITKQLEILNLLNSCEKWINSDNLLKKIKRLESYVMNYETFFILLKSYESPVTLVAHPLSKYCGYVFQNQHPFFIDIRHYVELIEI